LIIAVEKNFVDIIELLLKHENIDVNIQNIDGNTPLHISLYTNDDIAKLLLDHKDIDVNIQNIDGNTPLQITTNPEIIELIKNHKPPSQ